MMRAVVPWIGLSLLAAVAMPAAAQSIVQAADRGAIAAQVQSAWFAGDDAAFARVAASATGLATSSKAQDRYTLGFVQFRVLQRAIGAKRDKDAERAGAACVAATAAAVNADPKFVEAFALQSACHGYLANLGGLGAIRNGSRAAAAAFDAAGSGGAGGAGGIEWGAAEAHFWVGRCAREAGDAAAAQRSFERSLAWAPGFVAARRALGR